MSKKSKNDGDNGTKKETIMTNASELASTPINELNRITELEAYKFRALDAEKRLLMKDIAITEMELRFKEDFYKKDQQYTKLQEQLLLKDTLILQLKHQLAERDKNESNDQFKAKKAQLVGCLNHISIGYDMFIKNLAESHKMDPAKITIDPDTLVIREP